MVVSYWNYLQDEMHYNTILMEIHNMKDLSVLKFFFFIFWTLIILQLVTISPTFSCSSRESELYGLEPSNPLYDPFFFHSIIIFLSLK